MKFLNDLFSKILDIIKSIFKKIIPTHTKNELINITSNELFIHSKSIIEF